MQAISFPREEEEEERLAHCGSKQFQQHYSAQQKLQEFHQGIKRNFDLIPMVKRKRNGDVKKGHRPKVFNMLGLTGVSKSCVLGVPPVSNPRTMPVRNRTHVANILRSNICNFVESYVAQQCFRKKRENQELPNKQLSSPLSVTSSSSMITTNSSGVFSEPSFLSCISEKSFFDENDEKDEIFQSSQEFEKQAKSDVVLLPRFQQDSLVDCSNILRLHDIPYLSENGSQYSLSTPPSVVESENNEKEERKTNNNNNSNPSSLSPLPSITPITSDDQYDFLASNLRIFYGKDGKSKLRPWGVLPGQEHLDPADRVFSWHHSRTSHFWVYLFRRGFSFTRPGPAPNSPPICYDWSYLTWLRAINPSKVIAFFGENVMKVRSEILERVVEQVFEIEGNDDTRRVFNHLPQVGTKIHQDLILLQQGIGVVRMDKATNQEKVNILNGQMCDTLGRINFDWPGKRVINPEEVAQAENAFFNGEPVFKSKLNKTVGTKDIPVVTLYQLFRWSFAAWRIKQAGNHEPEASNFIPLKVDALVLKNIQKAQSRPYAAPLQRRLQPTQEQKIERLKYAMWLDVINPPQQQTSSSLLINSPHETTFFNNDVSKGTNNNHNNIKKQKRATNSQKEKGGWKVIAGGKKRKRKLSLQEQQDSIARTNAFLNARLPQCSEEEKAASLKRFREKRSLEQQQQQQSPTTTTTNLSCSKEEKNNHNSPWTPKDFEQLEFAIGSVFNEAFFECCFSSDHAFHNTQNYNVQDGSFDFEKNQLEKPTKFTTFPACPLNCTKLHQQLLKCLFNEKTRS